MHYIVEKHNVYTNITMYYDIIYIYDIYMYIFLLLRLFPLGGVSGPNS